MNSLKLIFLFSIFFSNGFLFSQNTNYEQKEASNRLISVDLNNIKGPSKKVWQKCIGAGRANEGLRADWQEQLTYLRKECGFKYIRMHGLLTDDMGVYFEDSKGNPIYNWQYIDKLYDYILSIGMKPFVELSFMPKALASGNQTIFWWKGNVTPPKSYDKWYDLIRALTQHFTDRYGEEEVKTWYFEVWNEPNLKSFFSGSMDDYFKLYDYTARAVKAVSVDYRVGGPATAGVGWIDEQIDYCVKNNSPIDFISTHDYATKGFLDLDGKMKRILDMNPKAVTDNVIKVKNQIVSSSKPNLELHITEWSASPSPFDAVHDSYQSPALILDKIKGTEDYANSMSYWTFTDIFEEPGPRTTPFHGGFGLLNYQSIKKPAFFAYKFLNRLGETEIENSDKASWVCVNENGDVQVLLYDFTILQKNDSLGSNSFYSRDLPAATLGNVKLNISNIKPGKYTMEMYKVGYRTNDAYAAYMDLGSPLQLTKMEVEQLKGKSNGEPIETENIRISKSKQFSKTMTIRENDVILLLLNKR